MKKTYINLAVSLAIVSILISGCAPEDSANDKKLNTPAVQNEESIKTEQAEENFAVGEEDGSIQTAWGALRNEHPVFTDNLEEIKGEYFTKSDMNEKNISDK